MKFWLIFLLSLNGCVYVAIPPEAANNGPIEIQFCLLASCADEGTASPIRTPTRTTTVTLPERLNSPEPEIQEIP